MYDLSHFTRWGPYDLHDLILHAYVRLNLYSTCADPDPTQHVTTADTGCTVDGLGGLDNLNHVL